MEQATGEDVTRLTEEVGATLRRVLAESPQVAHCLSRIRAEGYDVSVVLEATIGFSRVERHDTAAAPPSTCASASRPAGGRRRSPPPSG